LHADDPFLVAVGGEHRSGRGTDWAAAIGDLNQSVLSRNAFVRQVLNESDGAEQWRASKDVGVVAARVLWPLMQSTEQEQERVDGGLQKQGTRIGRALHAVYGNNISPDATMSLRFSDGRVQGYEYNGTLAPWATTFYGLYARGAEFGNAYPFDIPQPWLDNQDKITLAKKVCFASTNDIVGGNSGSCVVDQNLQVVGLIFDGNIESLPNDFYFSQKVARAVSVHTDAIVAALQHVYGMSRIVEELRDGASR
jgi:hypothetical protein